VDEIVLELPDDRAKLVDNRTMPNINVQHLVALTLVDGGMTFANSHDHQRMADPDLVALRRRIKLIANPELTSALPPRQVILAVKTKDGRELSHRTRAVKGTPDNPMNRTEVVEKALDLVGPIVGREQGEALVSAVIGIETVENVLTLRPLLQV
jgi:2-methylcitrate dehydratase PrpD